MQREPGETKLILWIELDGDPTTGSLTAEDRVRRRFSGWIGLSAAIQAVRSARSGTDSESRSDDGAQRSQQATGASGRPKGTAAGTRATGER